MTLPRVTTAIGDFNLGRQSVASMRQASSGVVIVGSGGPGGGSAPGDKTAPSVVTAAIVNGSKTTLTLSYDEALDAASTPATSSFTITNSGGADTVTAVHVTGATVVLTKSRTTRSSDIVSVSYTPGANKIRDASGNNAAALVGQAVTNSVAPILVTWDATAKITFDGNSLATGRWSDDLGFSYSNTADFASVAKANYAINAQQWSAMISDASDVDASFDASKATNALVVWEGTNSIYLGSLTAAQAAAQAQTYIGLRLAAHPSWRVVLVTCIPRYGSTAQCQAIADYNNILRTTYLSMGAHALCDLQVPLGPPTNYPSPYSFFGDTTQPFVDAKTYSLYDGSPQPTYQNDYTHLYAAAYTNFLCPLLAETLRTLTIA